MSDTAVWSEPQAQYRVEYSLALFHEIDFDVNEGYRRIPRGGIEVGGVLFGRVVGATIRIEARRLIECEHVFGPSFKLSQKDLDRIRQQIRDAKSDAELAQLEPMGWFIAHTRSELVLTDTEAQHFEDLFPGAGRVTVLVKPEKFKPTQFCFLVRTNEGSVPRDGASRAFILPLPGRAGSVPAPLAAPANDAPVAKVSEPLPTPSQPQVQVEAFPVVSPADPAGFEPQVEEAEPQRPAITATRTFVDEEPDLASPIPPAPAPVAPPAPSITVPPPPAATVEPVFEPHLGPTAPDAMQASPEDPVPAARRGSRDDFSPRPKRRPRREPERVPNEYARVLRRDESRPGFLFVAVIAAIALGCALGYWIYLQMPPEVLSVRLDPSGGRFLISWPPEQVRDADAVLMRINDGEPIPVPIADRLAGRTQIPITDPRGVKVEIIARHRLRDSRGIVRYVK